MEALAGSLESALDPFRAFPPNFYEDAHVQVARCSSAADASPGDTLVIRTGHFRLYRSTSRLRITHELRPGQLNNDLTTLLVDELFAPGWLHGAEMFHSIFTGLVRSTVDDPMAAWLLFYRNTVESLQRMTPGVAETSGCGGTMTGMAPVYDRAMKLAPRGRVLDLGSCFGFLPLLMAERGRYAVTAADISAQTMGLLAAVANAWDRRIETLVCDAARVPLADNVVETVTIIHLLEHLEPAHALAVVREGMRLATRRVIVAVPFEAEPNTTFGHIQTFDPAVLSGIGQNLGKRYEVSEYHGGWLVLHSSDAGSDR
jgi:SAM-dependent methyltransferase